MTSSWWEPGRPVRSLPRNCPRPARKSSSSNREDPTTHRPSRSQASGFTTSGPNLPRRVLGTQLVQAMSFNISTLLTRNLHDVFGENDPARRRAAIDEIFTEDCVFYEPNGGFRSEE